MPFFFFNWTPETQDHIDQHGVSVEEFERIVSAPEWTEPSRTSGRTIAFGEGDDGRLIACVDEQSDDENDPVTAYSLED
jgi:uncharacterized DUF497 family protein